MEDGIFGYTLPMGAKPALVRMILAGRDEGRDLEESLNYLARVFGRPASAERLGPHFSCAEANCVAWVLVNSRHPDAAVAWLDQHSASDAEGDPHGGAEFDAARYVAQSF
jgi:hypothetical protein